MKYFLLCLALSASASHWENPNSAISYMGGPQYNEENTPQKWQPVVWESEFIAYLSFRQLSESSLLFFVIFNANITSKEYSLGFNFLPTHLKEHPIALIGPWPVSIQQREKRSLIGQIADSPMMQFIVDSNSLEVNSTHLSLAIKEKDSQQVVQMETLLIEWMGKVSRTSPRTPRVE